MENQKPKYDIDELLGAVSTGNEPLQPEPEKLEVKLPGSDGSVSTFILPAPISFKNVCKNIPPLAPVLIPGMLRQGHKMMIASSSKAGKSFLVEELAIAVAHGKSWLNNPCKKGPVLYVNMELSDSSCWNRFSKVYEALNNSENGTSGNFNPSTTGNLDVWNLRGQQVTANQLAAAIEQLDKKYTLIILDPIYKLFEGSENDQESTANFCKAVDRMAETGASVVYVHHHSKGAQGSKSSMDRASGSGVFARDVDALLDLTQLFPGGKEPTAAEASKKTIWKVETTLREFARCRRLLCLSCIRCTMLKAPPSMQAGSPGAHPVQAAAPVQTSRQQPRKAQRNAVQKSLRHGARNMRTRPPSKSWPRCWAKRKRQCADIWMISNCNRALKKEEERKLLDFPYFHNFRTNFQF